jgi:hypothetical protein
MFIFAPVNKVEKEGDKKVPLFFDKNGFEGADNLSG